MQASKPNICIRYPPQQTVKSHINLLHTYNEIRDIGQGLMGMVADNRGVRVRDVYEEFGVMGAE
jgi:Swi5